MLSLLITLLIVLVIVGIVVWVIRQIPLPEPVRIVAYALIAIVLLLWLVSLLHGGSLGLRL